MKKLYLFALFLVIYEFTTYVANDMIMPGMLNVVKEFHAPVSNVSLSLTLYILGNCCLQLFLGPLSERFGKRRVILAGSAFFFIMTIFIALAQNIQSFMLARFLQGAGLGFIAVGYCLIQEKFNDKTAVKTFALMGNISILAPLLGPLFGVAVLMHFSWRAIFVVIGLLAIIAFVGLFKFTPITPREKKSPNLPDSIKIYWKIASNRRFIIGALSGGLGILPAINWIALSPTIIMKNQTLTMMDYGVYQLIAISGLMLSNLLMQFIAGKFRFSHLIIVTSFISWLGLALGWVFSFDLNTVAWGMFLFTFGSGIFNNLVIRLIMTTPDLPKNMVSSLMVFIQSLILSIGIEVATDLCKVYHYSLDSFANINFLLGCLLFVMVYIYARMHKNKQWD